MLLQAAGDHTVGPGQIGHRPLAEPHDVRQLHPFLRSFSVASSMRSSKRFRSPSVTSGSYWSGASLSSMAHCTGPEVERGSSLTGHRRADRRLSSRFRTVRYSELWMKCLRRMTKSKVAVVPACGTAGRTGRPACSARSCRSDA